MSECYSSLPTLHSGFDFTICIDDFGNIFSFGNNINGKCCHDIKNNYILPPKQINNLKNIYFISCGYSHTICCDYNGNIFSFGDNTYGQLGVTKTIRELSFSYYPQHINLPQIKQVSSGLFFSICLSKNGELWSFGSNSFGQLGIGNTNNSIKPLKIKNLSNIDYIVCGGYFSYCKNTSNDYYSWGKNNYGQLAQGHTNNLQKPHICDNIPDNILSIQGGSNHVLFLSSNGIVYSCADNRFGQLGHGDFISLLIPKEISILPVIKKISCGYNHNCCVDINDNFWVFGCNEKGQLGLGHNEDKHKPKKHKLLTNIIDISCSSDNTFLKTQDNKIFVFGDNSHLQLGIQTNINIIKTPIQVLKDNKDLWKTLK